MIWGYPAETAIMSETLHSLAGLLLQAPLYLTWAGLSPTRAQVILCCVHLFSLSWLWHLVLDSLQPWF